jgi:hypothetical protein
MTQDKVFREVVASKHKVRSSHIQFKLLVVLDTWTSLCGNPNVKKPYYSLVKSYFLYVSSKQHIRLKPTSLGCPVQSVVLEKRKWLPIISPSSAGE